MFEPEGDSLNDDLLFGSGPADWNGSTLSPQSSPLTNQVTDPHIIVNQLHDLHIDGDRDDDSVRHTENTTPRPNRQGVEGGARPKVNNADRLRPQTFVVKNETRNKSAKDKENKHKNSKKKENVQNGWFQKVSTNNATNPDWSPALQLVNYNHSIRRNGNSVKQKKQTMNENSALMNSSTNSLGSVSLHGNSNLSNRQHVINNTPDEEVCANDTENESEEFLHLPAGIDPNADPSHISRIYVRPGHVIPPNPLPDLNTESNSSMSENAESKSPSVNRIHNNLWENSKNCNVKDMPNVQNGLHLNAFRNDIDVDSDTLPLACADLPGFHRQSSNPGLSSDQIVNHFPGSNISANINGHANSPTLQQTGDSQITVPYYIPPDMSGDELSINLESLKSNLPTDFLFGDGNCQNDYLYAQQLQMQYDKQSSDYRTNMHYDEFTNMDYLNLSGDQRRGIASKQINNAMRNNCDRVMNDVYDTGLLDDGLSDSLFMTSQNQEADDDVRTISPDIRYGLPTYPDPSLSPSNSHCLRGQSLEDEQLARQIDEELRLKEDEDLARQLQMQDDFEQRAYPLQHSGNRRPDINEYRENSEPLHARYNRAWQTWQRPLTVPTSRHGSNVMDSMIRGVSSTERPLARRVPLDLVELEYLENVHSPTNEYRLLPGGRGGQYEFNPDYMLDDYGEESLVSISRDPRMLATLLMQRSPNMMIPNEIDLNDYEALWELAEGLGEVKRVGMEPNEILALPVHIYKGPTGSDDNKTDCLVCLSEFKKGEELRTLPCCHIYHVSCIDEWLKRNAICPVCRQSASQRG